MTRWLRKYNKFLLVAFGVFIMISFLVPQAVQQLGQGGSAGTTVLTIGGRKYSAQQSQEAAKERDAISRLTGGLLPTGLRISERGDHWLMSREEAARSGFVGGPSVGRSLMAELAPALASRGALPIPADAKTPAEQITAAQQALDDRRQQLEGSITRHAGDIDQAMAAVRGVMRMLTLYASAPRLSEPRIIGASQRASEQVEIQVLTLNVLNKLADDLPAREESALFEQFEKYKSVLPGTVEMPFGYVLAPRVRLEWLVIDRSAVQAGIRVDPVDVQKRLLSQGIKPADAAAMRKDTEDVIRNELTDKAMNECVAAVRSELLKTLSKLPEQGQYRELPADWAQSRPNFETIASIVPTRVQERIGVAVPALKVERRDQTWTTLENLSRLPGIGGSFLRRGPQRGSFPQLVNLTREILPDPRPENVPVALQVGVPLAEALEDLAGNRYFFTLLEALPKSPPKSINEVREEVVRDRKRADAYKSLLAELEAAKIMAAELGIEETAKALRERLGVPVDVRTVRLGRAGQIEGGTPTLEDPAFRAAAFAAAEKIDPSRSLDDVPAKERTFGVALPLPLGVAVGRVTGYQPLTQERLRALPRGFTQQLAAQSVGAGADNPFSEERLKARLGVEYRGRVNDPSEKGEKAERSDSADKAKSPGGPNQSAPTAPAEPAPAKAP